MKIPKSVRIGPYTYKVKKSNNIRKRPNGKNASGLCEHKTRTLWIESGLDSVEEKIVFMHECLHVIEYVYDLTLGEKKVEKLDSYLIDFITLNKLNFND